MIRNVIFDLGGVLWGINFGRTEEAFKKLQADPGLYPKVQYHFNNGEISVFDEYEVGRLSDAQFRSRVREELQLSASDPQIDEAWNAMLTEPFPESVEVVRRLRLTQRVFLLSNTNSIHIRHVQDRCADLFPLFEKVYLSYELGMRKPDVDIYRHVLDDAGLDASETVFIDDSFRNIEGATGAGIATIHLEHHETLGDDLAACLAG